MDEEIKKTVYAYIILPFVLTIFQRYLEIFREGKYKAKGPYLDKIETIISCIQDDLNAVKKQLYSNYHLKVRNLGKRNGQIRFDWQSQTDSGDLRFDPEELRALTEDMMALYLYGFLTRPPVQKERIWDV
ncbi:hypothetical protein [Aquibacillus salsiterrae]|uniref:Uncharacterized protein n=1 Tax=Aquibacillus salsiterrae TaxID=2950439 RepID=A0A9X3WD85_9BACI|nr:hypothetical protein [Aquibacillus salsiterrae]MDC3416301.1 hypothetical protein [Aquibacillus salsiterrae]